MISNQILQTTIDGLKNIARTDLSILDTEGKVLATTVRYWHLWSHRRTAR